MALAIWLAVQAHGNYLLTAADYTGTAPTCDFTGNSGYCYSDAIYLEPPNEKKKPAYMWLLEVVDKWFQRKERFKADYMVFSFDQSKRGFIPYYPWTLKRGFDIIVQ